jgi:sensor histidine kinase YesM
MKKITVVGCRLSRKSYRLLVIGYRGLVVWVMLLLGGILHTGIGQEMNYKFKKGQVIQYQYKAESNFQGMKRMRRDLFEFKVDSLYDKGAYITMTPKQYSSTSINDTKTVVPQYYQQSFIDGDNDPIQIAGFGDMNKPISFCMDSEGQLSLISGLDTLFSEITKRISQNALISRKKEINYNWLKLRYSEKYYKILIGQFFPPKSNNELGATGMIRFVNEKETIMFEHFWEQSNPDFITGIIQFKKTWILFTEDKITVKDRELRYAKAISKMDLGEAHWNRQKAIFDNLRYPDLNIPFLLFMWVNGDLKVRYGFRQENVEYSNISIELINDSDQEGVWTNLHILDADTMEMIGFYPGNSLGRNSVGIPILESDFKFESCAPLHQPGFIDFCFTPIRQTPYYEILNPNKIRIYAEPGDSMSIYYTMGHPEEIQFTGTHARENQLLNRIFMFNKINNEFPEFARTDYILQCIKEGRKLLESNRSFLDPDFVKLLDFELDYFQKEWELNDLQDVPHKQYNKSLKDTIAYYKQFLGQLSHPESTAYQGFILEFVSICERNAGIYESFQQGLDFRAASLFLQGWDRYWAMAKMTMDQLKDYTSDDYGINYTQFMADYGETPYGKQIKSTFGPSQWIKELDLKSKFNLIPFIGHPILVTFNFLEAKPALKQFIRDQGASYKSDTEFVIYIREHFQPQVLHWLQSITQSKEENLGNLASRYSLTFRNLTDSLFISSQMYDPILFLFDRDGKFVSFLPSDHLDEYQIRNILSWPALTPRPSKTINLTAFWFSFGGAVFGTWIIMLVIRLRAKRKEKRLILKRKISQLEVDAVRSRMNPHFLFNALSSIQNLINKKQIEEANLFLARFGELVRTILNQSSKPAIGLNEEIDMIRNYLQLEQLRFPFTYDIQINEALDTFAIEVPPLLIQPHVENAVMHGISGMGKEGRIDINFRTENNHLICEVKDNGPGYHPGTKTENGGLGQGWKLTRQRIELMKEQYGDDVSVVVKNRSGESRDNTDSSGTTVIFSLPMQKPSL